jgi:nucleotide-binding universal stress UspA family protein
MFERILIPLDGSPIAEAALAYAELLPSQSVRLLRVEPATGGSPPGREPDDQAPDIGGKDIAYLERAGADLRRQGRIVEPVVTAGDPAERIIDAASDTDLIVMTTRGLGARERILLGSVAAKVARQGPCPTLLIRRTSPPTAPPSVARVVVPLDGSTLATEAVPTAAEIARTLGVPVHLVQVLEVASPGATLRAGPGATEAYERSWEAARREAETQLDRHVMRLRNQDLMASKEILVGSPRQEILDAIAESDIVVMTPHGHGGIRRLLLGSVADSLVREAPCPVLIVRAASR